jgi:IS5 family transposase
MKEPQMSLATVNFDRFGKVTKRAAFLAEMDGIVPWERLCALIEPYYPKGETGRPPVGLERMLRIYFLQQWFNLSDPGVEEALYESISMRSFVGIDLGQEPVPDETTACKFRHLLERHDLGEALFAEVNRYLAERGMEIRGGTIVDATIIAAPSSTKNKAKARDPEMHSTKKGNAWHFGMKAHVGIDSATKLIHSMVATAANVHDSKVLPQLLHGEETRVWGDSAYRGQKDAIRAVSPRAQDMTNKRAYKNRPLSEADKATNRRKSHTRSRVEHIFGVFKGVFGFRKVRYRGLSKNGHRLNVLCALTNLFTQKTKLLQQAGA